jgi:NAD(P)-dependent dehydrogenase (short-subunit alcohol dehydrogenase family)
MAQFTDKNIVITGGTQGLGASIAMLFAERGAAGIITCGRNEKMVIRLQRAFKKKLIAPSISSKQI